MKLVVLPQNVAGNIIDILYLTLIDLQVRSVLGKYLEDLRTQRDIHRSVLYKRRQSVQSTNSKTHLTHARTKEGMVRQ